MRNTLGVLFIGGILLCGSAFAETWDTDCNNSDCFKNGWVTRGDVGGFVLRASCTNDDCRQYGWESSDNFGTKISVGCVADDCFGTGWVSFEKRSNGKQFQDFAECKGGNCLTHGWNVSTSYDDGGWVECKQDDCSKFGGNSYWRSRRSITTCKDNDCYHKGWTVQFLDPPSGPAAFKLD